MSFHTSLTPYAAISAIAGLLSSGHAEAQIVLQQSASPNTLVNDVLLGEQVDVDSVYFNGTPGVQTAPVGIGPSEIGRFFGIESHIGLDGGIFLCNGGRRFPHTRAQR